MPMNSRAHMEATIRNGVGVMLPDGRVVTDLAELPPEAELADFEVRVARRAARQAQAMSETDPSRPAALASAEAVMAQAEARQAAARAGLKAQAETIRAQLAALDGPPAPAAKVGPPPVAPAAHPAMKPAEPARAPEKGK